MPLSQKRKHFSLWRRQKRWCWKNFNSRDRCSTSDLQGSESGSDSLVNQDLASDRTIELEVLIWKRAYQWRVSVWLVLGKLSVLCSSELQILNFRSWTIPKVACTECIRIERRCSAGSVRARKVRPTWFLITPKRHVNRIPLLGWLTLSWCLTLGEILLGVQFLGAILGCHTRVPS